MAGPPRPRHFSTTARRRLIGLLVAGLILMVGAAAVVTHQARFASNTTLVFTGSPSIAEYELSSGAPVDPMTQSNLARVGSTRVVGDIFARIYRSSAKKGELAEAGLVGTYTVSTRSTVSSDTPDHGPVFTIVVISPAGEAATAGAQLILDDVRAELEERQRGYDPNLSVSFSVATQPTPAVQLAGSKTRVAVAFGFLAMLVGFCVPWTLRRLSRLRPLRISRLGSAPTRRADAR